MKIITGLAWDDEEEDLAPLKKILETTYKIKLEILKDAEDFKTRAASGSYDFFICDLVLKDDVNDIHDHNLGLGLINTLRMQKFNQPIFLLTFNPMDAVNFALDDRVMIKDKNATKPFLAYEIQKYLTALVGTEPDAGELAIALFSSGNYLNHLRELKSRLQNNFKGSNAVAKRYGNHVRIDLWEDIFKMEGFFLDNFLKKIGSYTYGIFLFAPDDETKSRDKLSMSVRDNVLFESGMYFAMRGIKHTVIAVPSRFEESKLDNVDFKVPSDLTGLYVYYYHHHEDFIESHIDDLAFNIFTKICKDVIADKK